MHRYLDKKLNRHHIYLDSERVPLLLPCLFARYTEVAGKKIELVRRKSKNSDLIEDVFEEISIGADASYKICNHLGRFLEWLEGYGGKDDAILSMHTASPQELINDYINRYLICEYKGSQALVNQAVNSLRAYYSWLQYFLIIRTKILGSNPHISQLQEITLKFP